jgi:hypothetical protein
VVAVATVPKRRARMMTGVVVVLVGIVMAAEKGQQGMW